VIRCVDAKGRYAGPEARFHPDPSSPEQGRFLDQVQSIGRHVDGRRDGVWWYFHPSGAKAAEHPYVAGELHGTLRRWAENGQEIQIGEYRVGRPWGLFVDRDEAGQERARAQLDAGTGTLVRDEAGRRRESDHVAGLLHGVHRVYDDQGRQRGESHWSGGEMHGLETRWDESGAKTIERSMVDGQQHGLETRWRAGQIVERSVWVAGAQRSRQLYRDGKPLAELPEPSDCDEDPGLSRALERSRGRGLPSEHACVTRNPLFPGLAVVGDFAHDAGCMGATWVVDCAVTGTALGSAAVLARAGWAEADGEQRIVIAKEYLRSFGLDHRHLSSTPEPPQWQVRDDGGVEAIVWVSEPSGMLPRQELAKQKLDFGPDGELASETLEQRTIEYGSR
jgi:antitoxin component YwqK of YwqJK toxin-antitoxin module